MSSFVLIIEDDSDNREIILSALQEQGIRAIGAANGSEALEILRDPDRKPCLVLLDLMMPVMNGWELLNALRECGTLASIPIFITSSSHPCPPGVNGSLRKPYALKGLVDLVMKHCGDNAQRHDGEPSNHDRCE